MVVASGDRNLDGTVAAHGAFDDVGYGGYLVVVGLTCLSAGVVHIGADRQDDFAQKATVALIEYVNTFAPADYSRTVYYLDFDMQIDIQVQGGKVTIDQSQISEEKINELFDKWYK